MEDRVGPMDSGYEHQLKLISTGIIHCRLTRKKGRHIFCSSVKLLAKSFCTKEIVCTP
jgi:hypothetical protein